MARLWLLLAAALWIPVAASGPLPTAEIRVGGELLQVELATDATSRRRGLMGRTELPAGTGMLFVYADEAPRAFWMKRTVLPLDIAYLDGDGRIVDIQTMAPQTLTMHHSRAPARYALEVPAGWFAAHAVHPGDRVDLGCVTSPDCEIDSPPVSD